MESLVAKVSPAVVQLVVIGYGPVEQPEQRSTALLKRQKVIGSGVIVDSDGYIVTNAHVIQGAEQIEVILPARFSNPGFRVTDRVLKAVVIGADQESDLAVLKVDATNLPTVSLASSQDARQGELVFAIGSPSGLEDSVTMGVVSSPLRQPDPDIPLVYIQTDAPINPGNSGGPLVDVDGSLVGINTMILTQGGGSEGIGFAIPAAFVRFVYRSLREHGRVDHAEIGIQVQDITPDLAAGLGLARKWGVIVSDSVRDEEWELPGPQPGDVLVSVDHHPIVGVPSYTAAMNCHQTDQPVEMTVLRVGKAMSFVVPVIYEREGSDEPSDTTNLQHNLIAPLGVFAVDLNEQMRSLLRGLRSGAGVLVVAQAADPESVHDGLQPGDVIRTMNHIPIRSLAQLREVIGGIQEGKPLVLQIERQGRLRYLAFELNQ